jgi:hypothetical protein
MSQNKSDFRKSDKDNKTNKQPYHSPKLYLLGSIDSVQANPTGSQIDGPNNLYFFA